MIDITIPIRVPIFNELVRMHHTKRSRALREISDSIWYALPLSQRMAVLAKGPMAKARITITRYASGKEPDPDGLSTAQKLVLDALQPQSKRHPVGLGIITDDTRKCVEVSVKHAKLPREKRLTRIVIEDISNG